LTASRPTRAITMSVAALSLTLIMSCARSRSDMSISSTSAEIPVPPVVLPAAGTRMRSVACSTPPSNCRASSTATGTLNTDARTTGSSASTPASAPVARSLAWT
jgi:hypothetical protein